MPMTKQSEIEYWAIKLDEVSERSAALHTVWHSNHKLEIEEQYEAMSLLMDVQSYSTLLDRALARPEPKLSLWKRIRNK